MKTPLRTRLTFWSTLSAGVAVLVCGSIAIFLARRELLTDMHVDLERKSRHFYSELAKHGGKWFDWRKADHEVEEWLPIHDPLFYVEIRAGEKVRWRSKNMTDGDLHDVPPPGMTDVDYAGKSIRLFTATEDGVTASVGYARDEIESQTWTMVWGMLAGLPVALGFALIGGRRLASLALRPVEEMTRATADITAAQLDRRVPVPPASDEIRRHAEVLNTTLDRLERSYHQSLRFSADASHELKTALTVMRSTIEDALAASTCTDSTRPVLTTLLEQTRRLSDITSSLLLLARADAGALVMDKAEHDLSSLTEACVEDASIQAERCNVSVTCELPARAPAKVDVVRFYQIVSNLLDNAVKYNRPEGKVAVRLSDASPFWRLTVSNTGKDIPGEDIPHLFSRFFRAAQGTSPVPGHGLGLSLARELATAHGGDLQLIRSEQGWTEFSLMMPQQVS